MPAVSRSSDQSLCPHEGHEVIIATYVRTARSGRHASHCATRLHTSDHSSSILCQGALKGMCVWVRNGLPGARLVLSRSHYDLERCTGSSPELCLQLDPDSQPEEETRLHCPTPQPPEVRGARKARTARPPTALITPYDSWDYPIPAAPCRSRPAVQLSCNPLRPTPAGRVGLRNFPLGVPCVLHGWG